MLLFTTTVKNWGALMIGDHLCPNEGSCTVSLRAGVQFPQSFSVLVHYLVCVCLLVLDLKSGGITLTLLGPGHSPQAHKNNLGTMNLRPWEKTLGVRTFMADFLSLCFPLWGFRSQANTLSLPNINFVFDILRKFERAVLVAPVPLRVYPFICSLKVFNCYSPY